MNFSIGSVSEKERILKSALESTINFGLYFLSDDFRIATTEPFHYLLGQEMDNLYDVRPLIFCIPRGHAKTQITKASILREFYAVEAGQHPIIKDFGFFIWIAETQRQSKRNVAYCKHHIENNPKLKYFFGVKKGNIWNQEDFTTACGNKLISGSNLTSVRGAIELHRRPDRIILDDFEGENNTKTQDSRDSNADTVTAAVIPAVNAISGRVQINQTPVHYDAFVVRVLKNYKKHIDGGGKPENFGWRIVYLKTSPDNPLWPSYIGRTELLGKKKIMSDANQLHRYYQEYEMRIQNPDDSLFSESHIRYWNGELVIIDGEAYLNVMVKDNVKVEQQIRVNLFTGSDIATDIDSFNKDYTVIMTVAVDEHSNLYVLGYIRKRSMRYKGLPGGEIGSADAIFQLNKALPIKNNGIEDVGINRGVFQSLDELKIQENYYSIPIRPIPPGVQSKRERVYAELAGRFGVGRIYIKEEHTELKDEIVTFGSLMQNDDVIDSLHIASKVSYPPKPLPKGVIQRPSSWYEKPKLKQPESSWFT